MRSEAARREALSRPRDLMHNIFGVNPDLSLSLYIYIYIFISVYIYIYIYTHTYVYVYIYMCLNVSHTHAHTCTPTRILIHNILTSTPLPFVKLTCDLHGTGVDVDFRSSSFVSITSAAVSTRIYNICVYVHVYIYIYVYIHIQICGCACVYIYICMYR